MKKVIVKKESDTVELKDVSKNKIYAMLYCNHIYILHSYPADNKYCFFSINNTTNYAKFGTTMENAISNPLLINDKDIPVYEFDTQREFLEWALENTN